MKPQSCPEKFLLGQVYQKISKKDITSKLYQKISILFFFKIFTNAQEFYPQKIGEE